MVEGTPTEAQILRELIGTDRFRPSKARGQNFLIDRNLADALVREMHIGAEEAVFEIGPGAGVLTRRILEQSSRVKVVEIEDVLCQALARRIPELDESGIIHADVRDVTVEEIFSPDGLPCVVMSNVPYSISSDVVLWTIENRHAISRAGLLFQTEFAKRLVARPGSKTYGSLTVLRSLFADAEIVRGVPMHAFMPVPSVSSSFVRMMFLEEPRAEVADVSLFQAVVREAFSKRRKTLLNALCASGRFGEKDAMRQLILSVGLDPGSRAEVYSSEAFARLVGAIETKRREEA